MKNIGFKLLSLLCLVGGGYLVYNLALMTYNNQMNLTLIEEIVIYFGSVSLIFSSIFLTHKYFK